MQPHDRDDGIRRNRPPGVPTDMTADQPKPPPPDAPLPDVDVRARGPGWRRLMVLTAVGAASGFALALLGNVGCHAAAAVGGGTPGDLGIIFGQCFLVFAPVVGGLAGLVFAVLWPPKPPRPTWSE